MKHQFDEIGLSVPTILLPAAEVDMTAWAVVACDQYTSQPEYWEEAAELVHDRPSTLKLILPEVYLETEKEEEIITSINRTMKRYIHDGILKEEKPGFILLDRQTSHVPSRKGLMVALDLEHYDYRPGSQTLMRATEGTIVDRLPPRVRVRKDALVELPHIMVLIDDPDRTVIEPLFEGAKKMVYDTDLMLGGGHVKGWLIDEEKEILAVARALKALAGPTAFNQRYGVKEKGVLLYAMGDGNHSFATAKTLWEKIKAEAADPASVMNHPARHALVELVNIHDAGLAFEPIHRILFNTDPEALLASARKFFQGINARFTCESCTSLEDASARAAKAAAKGDHALPMVTEKGFSLFRVEKPALSLVVATLQRFLDDYLTGKKGTTIDYIHGDEVVTRLGSKKQNVGFYLPPLDKNDFFRTIIVDETLPRKTFSMGEADEKRYYLECRRITR